MQLINQTDDMINQISNSTSDDSDDSSDDSYKDSKEDEIVSDYDSDEDSDNHFYNVEDMLNTRVFDEPNQDIYTTENFITKVKIETILPFGELTSFDHKVHEKRKKMFQPYINKMLGLKLYILQMA